MIKYFNCPRYVKGTKYDSVIQRVIEKLKGQQGVISIFQIGSIGTPGISDIDLLVVFEDNQECKINPLEKLTRNERYLFTHGVFGASKKHFYDAQRYTFLYTFFHNNKLLCGDNLDIRKNDLTSEEMKVLKSQIATEFLISNYISKTVEQTYGIVNLRNLFLTVKALRYDLELLKISSGKFVELISTFMDWRRAWFENRITDKELNRWFKEFYLELQTLLQSILKTNRLFLPEWANYRYAPHVLLTESDNLGYNHNGIRLPPAFRFFGKKYLRLQHRFNHFKFFIPVTNRADLEILNERFLFLKNMKDYNRQKLCSFSPLTNNLGCNVV